MTRLAYVCADPGIPVFGTKGAAVHVREVVRALRRGEVHVELFATRTGGPPPRDLDDVAVHPLPVPTGGLADREASARAANAPLLDALSAAGPFDMVYERYSLWSWAGMAWARAGGAAGLLEVNAPLVDEQAHRRGLSDRAAAETVAARVLGEATAVVAVSGGVAEWARRRVGDPGAVHVVANAVDPTRFAAPARRGDAATFTVGFVGSLKPWHGVTTLVAALAHLVAADGTYRLRLVGDGPERARLEQAVQAAGISHATTFTGAVDPDDVPGQLALMDVATAPYPDTGEAYFSPLKITEYLAAGVPVVASAVPAVREAVTDGVDALLCAPGDPVALAAAIARLRAQPALRRTLADAGRRRIVAEDRTWDAVAKRILALGGGGMRPCATSLITSSQGA